MNAPFCRANVVGADAQNFNPTSNGLDFVTVQSSEPLQVGVFNLGLFLNRAVNSLPYFDSNSGNRLNFSDELTSLDFNFGFGLAENWDIGLSLPQVIKQNVNDSSGSRGEFAATGITELRLNTKYRFFGDSTGGLALVTSANFNLIQNNPFTGQDAGPTMNLELVMDTMINRWSVGGNIGYRARSKGTKIPGSVADPLGNQFIGSAAASYHFPQYSTKVITEIFASSPASSDANSFNERSLKSLEWLVGVKHDYTTNLALHLGGGTELVQGIASPDWRIYAGLNYAFGPVYDNPKNGSESKTNSPKSYLESVPISGDTNAIMVSSERQNQTQAQERFRTQSIQFEFDSDRMIGRYDLVLSELVANLDKGFSRLNIEGHTDSVGSSQYNETLSLKRANAIKKRLIEKFRLSAHQIKAAGFGESRPIADNANYQGRQVNRRVEFEIER
jgi:outer membrane protein OmpA-like peptidoglycan-associated protein